VFKQKRFQFMLENGSNSFWEIVGYLKTSQFIVRHSTRWSRWRLSSVFTCLWSSVGFGSSWTCFLGLTD